MRPCLVAAPRRSTLSALSGSAYHREARELDKNHSYSDFFKRATGFAPWPYQERLAHGPWPEQLQVPTGLGKTAAVLVGWLYRRQQACAQTPRHLVYCLPRRALLGQTVQAARRWVQATAPLLEQAGQPRPVVEVLVGPPQSLDLAALPRRPSLVLVASADTLPRPWRSPDAGGWPARLAREALWIHDEPWLEGAPAPWLPAPGPAGAARVLMTATSRVPSRGEEPFTLQGEDWRLLQASARLQGHKPLLRSCVRQTRDASAYYPQSVARLALARHLRGTLTLVVLNQEEQARAVHRQLLRAGRRPEDTGLLHASLDPRAQAQQEATLHQSGDRIVVTTPSIEAGVDVSACALLTELAPWPALVQRAGRCNRYNEQRTAQILWLDIEDELLAQQPYDPQAMRQARALLCRLGDMNLTTVRSVQWKAS